MLQQLLRSATSVGANYSEAQNAISRKDFRSKLYICKKEIQETVYWFDVIGASVDAIELKKLETESKELAKIIQAICSKLERDQT